MALRVKLFIDSWNFQLAWNAYHRSEANNRVVIPWHPRLYNVITSHIDPTAVYAGTHVYASYDPASAKDVGLKKFLTNTMDAFPGYRVILKERKALNPAKCPHDGCRKPITHCPHCARELRRTVEKGVDTALVTDLIRYGIDDHYDRAVLIAGDADHVPAVEFLGGRMRKVTHVWFRNQAIELRKACWDHVLFDTIMGELLP